MATYKIKDSVDLKELEGFGFVKDNEIYSRKSKKVIYGNDTKPTQDYIAIKLNREVVKCCKISNCFNTAGYNQNNLKYDIQDLIDAGLVEEIEEE